MINPASESRRLSSLGPAASAIAALAVSCCFGCGQQTPYPLVQVTGSVAYGDGSLIPAEMIIVKFEPLVQPLDRKTHPRAGMAYVDVATGQFDAATTHRYGDGIVEGEHRVLIIASNAAGQAVPLTPPEYIDSERSPLAVHTDETPFELLVRKP